MRLTIKKLAFITSLVYLSACTTTEEKQGSILKGTQENGNNAVTKGYAEGVLITGEQLGSDVLGSNEFGSSRLGSEFNDPLNPLSKHIIYFMYDSSQVQQDYISVIAAHANYLVNHPAQRIILGGHADERGSREYNIALGEQRAKSVYRMMKLQGVTDDQLEIVSYGEEKPVANGMNEASWQRNRRVEIIYQGQ